MWSFYWTLLIYYSQLCEENWWMRAHFSYLLVSESSCFPYSTTFTSFTFFSRRKIYQPNQTTTTKSCYSDAIMHKLKLKKLLPLLLTTEIHLDLNALLTLSIILSNNNRNLKLESHFNLWLHLNIFHPTPWIFIFNHSSTWSARVQWNKRWEDWKLKEIFPGEIKIILLPPFCYIFFSLYTCTIPRSPSTCPRFFNPRMRCLCSTTI